MKRVLLTVALLAVAVPAFAQFGGLSRAIQTGKKLEDLDISEDKEREIGSRVSENIRKRYGVVQDAPVHRYVSLVGAALVASGPRASQPWHFIVLDTDGVNAFAAPGGFVHITRGALALIRNESELAGVLAHEIVHVTEEHTIKAIKKGNAKELGFELSGGDGLTQAVIARLADHATDLVLAGFGRGEELESDEKGIALANRVGYAPAGLGTFLTRLTERNKEASERRGLFASHPEMAERLERLQKEITREKLAAAVVLADRYAKFITYQPVPQTEIAQIEGGAAGLTGGGKDEKKEEPPKKRGFGLGGLVKPGGEEKKSAQVTGSGGARGVDPERNAKGGSNPALVAVNLTPADIAAFKKEGQLK